MKAGIVPLFILSSAISVGVSFAAKCSLCQFGSIQQPDLEIPLLNIPGPVPVTCGVADQYADILDDTDPVCDTIRHQSAYCQCTNATKPTKDTACNLCSDGSMLTKPDRRTASGDTCQELSDYLTFLTKDQCQSSTHAKTLLDSAFGCGCQGATASCPMCPDGTIDVSNPDKYVPFVTLDGDQMEPTAYNNPTCSELAFLGSTADPNSRTCEIIKAQAGFCGCANVAPKNECFLCPNELAPARGDLKVATGDSCQDLYDYMSYLDKEECETEQAQDIKALAFTCGCPDTKPQCSLCPDGLNTFDPDINPFNDDETCLDIALSIAGLPDAACEEQRKSITGISAARCKCKNADFPVCATQQNPSLCTEELLANATETCECYSFCDGVFAGCTKYPGGLLSSQACPQNPVTGCNYAMVKSNKKASAATFVSAPIVAWLGCSLFSAIAFS